MMHTSTVLDRRIMDYETVKDSVLQRMASDGLTQKAVAAEVDIDPSTLSRWKTGSSVSSNVTALMHTWALNRNSPQETVTKAIPANVSIPVPTVLETPHEEESFLDDLARSMERLSVQEQEKVRNFGNKYPTLNRQATVYVMQSVHSKRYKIGRSKDAMKRLKEHNTGGADLRMVMVVVAGDAVSAESWAHHLLKAHRVKESGPGCEMFNCTQAEATLAVVTACEKFPPVFHAE